MPRTKNTVASRERKKKYLKAAKGFFLGRSKLYRTAREAVERSMLFAYRDRRVRKRDFRKLWIIRINAAARLNGMSYNRFINGLKIADVEVNRKMLAEMAVNDTEGFKKLAEIAKTAIGAAG